MIPAEQAIVAEMKAWDIDRLPAIRRIQDRAILVRRGAHRRWTAR
ncbi:MAG: hypothetical protein ABIR02_08240 [Novosphingobium sp.]